MWASVFMVFYFFYQVQSQGTCKSPYVEQRLLSDDVRYASPFYVIALPKTPQTLEMDNVCYTYFENNDGGFFHIMSITYKNGSNAYYDFSKGDITNRMGIAEGKSGECVYHDYTLKPICNVTVFILYRCYIQGKCSKNIDVGAIPGVDVRVTLAASPKVSPACQAETESSLRDTSALAGGDYILLPQKLTPNCITKYDNLVSIGSSRALGPKEVSNDVADRFAAPADSVAPASPTKPSYSTMSSFFKNGVPPPSAFNPYGHPANGASAPYPPATPNGASAPYPPATPNGYSSTYSSGGSYAYANSGGYSGSQPTAPQGQTPAPTWSNAQFSGQPAQPGIETHYHIWQTAGSAAALKAITSKNPNIYYHIHSWAPPQGCCKCA
ncbi:uncharacterized protein LOC129004423 [Macrosteles quadrilineatus]|uniref:uncharacterized protein LOC129004423 n=1 Tax=Macrosteles quadrilineatus TaxID=74068 RepID=UPI0023E1154C|nr:uncharacterized protein LOC129004423 [Macrosteles quadrilineatus]